jgi:hypothetical protein
VNSFLDCVFSSLLVIGSVSFDCQMPLGDTTHNTSWVSPSTWAHSIHLWVILVVVAGLNLLAGQSGLLGVDRIPPLRYLRLAA